MLALQKAINIDKARKSLDYFVKHMKPSYQMIWFHRYICDVLTKFMNGTLGYSKVMIFVPPQHGKSELSSRTFPAWCLGDNPDLKMAVCSYSDSLAGSFNRNIQQIIDSPQYSEVFPNTRISGKDTRSNALRNNDVFEIVGHSGYLKSVGVGGPLTGTAVDLGIIDDPYKDRKDARSQTIRNNVWDWYTDVFSTRLHNDSKQLLLFTRWHEDDLAGRLLAQDDGSWYVVAIPALREIMPPLKQAVDINDPRGIDEALWEERHSAEKIRNVRETSPLTFNSLYQQRPSAAEGNMIKREWFEVVEAAKGVYAHEIYIDGAFTKNTKNDPTGITFFLHGRDQSFIKTKVDVHLELFELLEYLPKFCEANDFDRNRGKIFIEPKASGQNIHSMLRKKGFNTILINNKNVALGKESRVEDAAPSIQAGKVKLIKGAWNESFLDQLASFPNGTHDEQVDNLCYFVLEHFVYGQKRGLRKVY
jgi:predicted phage terminase large subunit-like protein